MERNGKMKKIKGKTVISLHCYALTPSTRHHKLSSGEQLWSIACPPCLRCKHSLSKYSWHFLLSPGWKVPPAKDKGGEAAEEGGWILAQSRRSKGGAVSQFQMRELVPYIVKVPSTRHQGRGRRHTTVRHHLLSLTFTMCTHHSIFSLCRMYSTSSCSLIPLPDPNTSLNLAAHPSQYPELSKGTVILVLYPDTTTFYHAEVVTTPRDTLVAGLRVHITLRTLSPQ